MNTINFAIDLGTTNSLIAGCHSGILEVYKNPIGHREMLPSVVGFRGDRILVGDKAKEYLEKDPENVFGGFKRKMGTTENLFVKNLQQTKSPIELSSIILKELKTFVYTSQKLNSVVITIPASFDTVQSNATKAAGFQAGFKEVVLLQEPIAACLAFANKGESADKKGKWLVYDLGGGTFDVAIVEITDTELRVIDHKGDNYLGGLDFDNLIVEKIILKNIYSRPGFSSLEASHQSGSVEFKKLYQILLHKAEASKKELSISQAVEVDLQLTDDTGAEKEITVTVTRSDFNQCISEKLSYSLALIDELFVRNNLKPADLRQVVMVGGSTYIPLVRESIEERFNLKVNTSVDPTTAVVVGAAHYAATKRSDADREESLSPEVAQGTNPVKVRTSYLKTSMDLEELLMVSVEGYASKFYYRVQREDGGFDSGLKVGSEKIREYLTLAGGGLNRFILKLYTENNEPITAGIAPIEITQGKFNVQGQPLPEDICLEVDDVEQRTTKLELIFSRNSILPLKKSIYREVSKTLFKTNTDKLIVNILEGDRHATPATNAVIGVIEIDPSELKADLVKGSDLEIKLEISESRDLSVSVYLALTEQEFKNVFSPTERYVSLGKLEEDINILNARLKRDLKEFEYKEDFEMAAKLSQYLQEGITIRKGLDELNNQLNNDEKYHLEERKRRLAQKYDHLGKDKKLTAARIAYFEEKNQILARFHEPHIRQQHEKSFDAVIKDEAIFTASESLYIIDAKTKQLAAILSDILVQSTEYMISLYHHLSRLNLNEFKDKEKAKVFFEQGEKALERQNYSELKVVNLNLLHLLPEKNESLLNFKGTGIG